jgi:Sec-independent protein translocase protein TatA
VVVGVGGVLANGGDGHALSGNFALFGYHVTGSTGTLFLYGIVVGAVGLCGLSLLLAGARRTARRGRTARRDLKQSRRETAVVSTERDDLAEQQQQQRETADAQQRETGQADAPAVSGTSPDDTTRRTAPPAAEGSTSSTAAQPSRQPAGSAQGEGPSNQAAR